MKPAFSTVACPDWTLPQIARFAAEAGFLGVELRTFGHGSHQIAGDPLLTSESKVRELFDDEGVRPVCLASSISFDKAIFPPVIGRALFDDEAPVRQAKGLIEFAAKAGVGLVRVYPFELRTREPRNWAVRRIVDRLELATRACRHTGVKLTLENGGSFPKAADLLEFLAEVDRSDLTVSYNAAAAQAAGEDPREGLRTLLAQAGDRVAAVKLTDHVRGRPVALGTGELGVQDLVRELAGAGSAAWAVVEWPRLWIDGLEPADRVLRDACEKLFGWWADAQPRRMAVGRAAVLA